MLGWCRRPLAALATLPLALAALASSPSASRAATGDAPGAPGIHSSWTTGAKQGLGTSTTAASRVWYTIGQGITDEVYYPQTDTPDVQDLQYVVTDGSTFVDLERDATAHQVSLAQLQTTICRLDLSGQHDQRIRRCRDHRAAALDERAPRARIGERGLRDDRCRRAVGITVAV